MPPKKAENGTSSQAAAKSKESSQLGVEDLLLPKTLVQRLAKGVLPPNTQIQKDAVLAMSKSATVFINYLSSQANENAHLANKKTVMPNHVFEALEELEFPGFIPRLKAELEKYNALQTEKRTIARSKISQAANGTRDAATASGKAAVNGSPKEDRDSRSGDEEGPAQKKVRFSDVGSKNGLSHQDDEDDADDIDDTNNAEDEEIADEDEELDEDDADINESDEEARPSKEVNDMIQLEEPEHSQEEESDEALEDGSESD